MPVIVKRTSPPLEAVVERFLDKSVRILMRDGYDEKEILRVLALPLWPFDGSELELIIEGYLRRIIPIFQELGYEKTEFSRMVRLSAKRRLIRLDSLECTNEP